MARLKSFLGCMSLRTGSLFAAVAGMVLAVIGIIMMYTINVAIKTIVFDWLDAWIVRLIMAICFAMTIPISILLIFGVVKRNMFLMLPWVILTIMLAIGLLFSVIYTSVKFYIDGDNLNGTFWIVFGIISFFVILYMWLVTYSFFAIIKEEYDRGAYIKDPFRRQY